MYRVLIFSNKFKALPVIQQIVDTYNLKIHMHNSDMINNSMYYNFVMAGNILIEVVDKEESLTGRKFHYAIVDDSFEWTERYKIYVTGEIASHVITPFPKCEKIYLTNNWLKLDSLPVDILQSLHENKLIYGGH